MYAVKHGLYVGRRKMSGAERARLCPLEHAKKMQRNKARAQRIGQQKRQFVDAKKLEKGCADCGYREHAIALDFDHLPGTKKQFTFARFTTTNNYQSFETVKRLLEEEMMKCEVVCANCHRVRTMTRRRAQQANRQ